MSRQVIHTENAPAAIGTYSQAILVGDTLYLSGQIGLDPYSMELPALYSLQKTLCLRR